MYVICTSNPMAGRMGEEWAQSLPLRLGYALFGAQHLLQLQRLAISQFGGGRGPRLA